MVWQPGCDSCGSRKSLAAWRGKEKCEYRESGLFLLCRKCREMLACLAGIPSSNLEPYGGYMELKPMATNPFPSSEVLLEQASTINEGGDRIGPRP